MEPWKDVEKHLCSTGKPMMSKREAAEALHKLQRGSHRRRTYKEISNVYMCPLCGCHHISSKEHYSEEDKEQKPLIHGEEFSRYISNNENE